MISVGIDVSKKSGMVCILKPYGEVLQQPHSIAHNQEALAKLTETIKQFNEPVKVVMEATGIYHLPLVCYLKEQSISVSVVNPMLMKKYASVSLRKAKTDKLDALKIAKFGLDYWMDLDEYRVEDNVYCELHTLSRHYFQFMNIRIKQKVMLSNLLEQIMPGIDAIISSHSADFIRDKTLDFACKYKHFEYITKMGEKRFNNAKALVAYAGIDAPPYESGQFKASERKISKRGSRYIRKVGFEVMKCLMSRKPRNDSAIYDYIHKKISQGKAKKQAMIAGLNKFLRIYYARVKEVKD